MFSPTALRPENKTTERISAEKLENLLVIYLQLKNFELRYLGKKLKIFKECANLELNFKQSKNN